MPFQQPFVAGRAPSCVQGYQIKWSRIRGAVIGRVRDQLEMCELAVAHFVGDLARFGIAVWIVLLGLQRAQNLQRPAGEFRIDQDILQRNDQAIAAERSDEPRQSGRRYEGHVIRAPDRQTECGHVLQRLVKQTVEFLVACLDLDHGLQPFRHRLGMVGLVTGPDTILRRVEVLLAILERVEQAGMPSLAGFKCDVEAEPSIGGNGLARCARHGSCHSTLKILVRIHGAEPLPPLRPFSGDLATAYDTARLHLEDVGKVASEADLELKTHRLHAVVGDVEIFVHAAADRSTDGKADRARENRTVFGERWTYW